MHSSTSNINAVMLSFIYEMLSLIWKRLGNKVEEIVNYFRLDDLLGLDEARMEGKIGLRGVIIF